MKAKTLLGLITIGAGIGYLYMSNQEDEQLEGFNIDLKPDLLIDSAVRMSMIPDRYKDGVANASKKVVSGFIAGRGMN